MTTVANYRSIFTNNNIDDSKGLYEATKLVATNGGSGNNNLPFIFVNLVEYISRLFGLLINID